MLVKGSPQFETQDDFGRGDGISSIPQWHYSSNPFQQKPDMLNLDGFDLDPELQNILNRLRDISRQPRMTDSSNIPTILSPSDLHDLTCFVLHKLLRSLLSLSWTPNKPSYPNVFATLPLSTCLLYMGQLTFLTRQFYNLSFRN